MTSMVIRCNSRKISSNMTIKNITIKRLQRDKVMALAMVNEHKVFIQTQIADLRKRKQKKNAFYSSAIDLLTNNATFLIIANFRF